VIKKIVTKLLGLGYRLSPKILKRLYYKINSTQGKNIEFSSPGHVVKQKAIKEYQRRYHSDILVETGTYLGEMVLAQMKNFKIIYSIELDKQLWKDAAKKFSKYSNIHILRGDSGQVLKSVVPKLEEKSIFWLDGHYSGGITAKGEKECPIFEELDAILKSKINHVVLIDDARLFNGQRDYPTIKSLSNSILKKKPNSTIEIKDDIIRIVLG